MHVLITGGAGFIGSHLADLHIKQGDSVYVVDDLSTGSEHNIKHLIGNPNFKFEKANILTWDGFKEAIFWADRIYHMAAVVGMFKVIEEPTKVMAINVAGCERLLRFAKESVWSPQIVIASSSEVYGRGETHTMFKETDPLVINSVASSRWNYAISKLADEALAISYYKKYGIKVIPVRLFNIIGTRQTGRYGMVVPRFVRQALNNDPITVYGKGTQSRSFCDVRDAVKFLHELCDNPKSYGQIVNVGDDQCISILELAKLVLKITKSSSKIEYIPYSKVYGTDYEEVIMRKPDLNKLYSLIKYRHKYCLVDTIKTIVEFERKQKTRILPETSKA